MSARADEAERVEELLAVIEGHYSELVSAVRGMQVNGVLWVELVVIPPSGRYTVDSAVPFAGIAVFNHTAAALVIASGPERESVPTAGVGVQMLNAGKGATFALTGNVLTLYGTAGQSVSLQIYSRPLAPNFA